MLRTKQYNSSLHNISKKRQAEMASGMWKPKPRATIRKTSKKAASLWAKARRECLERYGHRCFICGSTGELHCHHWLYTRAQRPDLKYDQDNLCVLCAKCHNHTGADARFYELQKQILTKMKGEKTNGTFNH
jgi:hypothetical protein